MEHSAMSAAAPVILRVPSKYANDTSSSGSDTASQAPPLDFLHRTWTVSHSTLSMWRSARNVRITYKPLPATVHSSTGAAIPRIDDLVEYEKCNSNAPEGQGKVKTVEGIDTASPDAPGSGRNSADNTTSTASPGQTNSDATRHSSWNWRGKGWLFFVHSHWEVLGWGERPMDPAEVDTLRASGDEGTPKSEKWVVTWFAPTLFTKEGVDVYSDRKEGPSKKLVDEIMGQLKELRAEKVVKMVEEDMREVEIRLPWSQG